MLRKACKKSKSNPSKRCSILNRRSINWQRVSMAEENIPMIWDQSVRHVDMAFTSGFQLGATVAPTPVEAPITRESRLESGSMALEVGT